MQYHKVYILKDGQECLVRNPGSDDAEAVLEHLVQTSGETDYLSRYADEIQITAEQERQFLSKMEYDSRSVMLSAFIGDRLVGNAGVTPLNAMERYRHRAEVGISVKKDWWGKGVGSVLLEAAIASARNAGYAQLELEVVEDNKPALELYRKYGFEEYGRRERSMRLRDGSYKTFCLFALRLI